MGFPDSTHVATLDDRTFTLLRRLISERLGICYEDGKRAMLVERLAPLMAERGIESFLDYYYLLKYNKDSQEEWHRVEEVLTVGETYFWREKEAIMAAANHLIPSWQQAHPSEMIHIWSAGCATGEEPYSLAIALLEAGAYRNGPIEILGTDTNRKALQEAREALYRGRSFRALPHPLRERYFQPEDNGWRLRDEVRSRVHFAYLNLMDESAMSRMRGFHLIFCRNVFIYFSRDNVRRVALAFHHSLRSDGYLCLGVAESLLTLDVPFELVEIAGAFFYHKRCL
ncbi:MAG: protein-glutamate O-methyltransferase CheR [Anaerolineae bacterium]|nr:protein-glutamate O-methyltransferase CheR [Anaerolineae bacterium]